jgi:hypothetical protein
MPGAKTAERMDKELDQNCVSENAGDHLKDWKVSGDDKEWKKRKFSN